jgi:hypothetical protein
MKKNLRIVVKLIMLEYLEHSMLTFRGEEFNNTRKYGSGFWFDSRVRNTGA